MEAGLHLSSGNTRKTARCGFTLIEILVVIAIIGVLAGLVLGAGHYARLKGAEAKTRSGLGKVGFALNEYVLKYGIYPRNLAELYNLTTKLPDGFSTTDAWGNEYIYTTDSRSYTLYSLGPLTTEPADDMYIGK